VHRVTLVALVVGLASQASAQLRPPLFTLRPVIGSVEDRFGNGLAIARDQVLVAGFNEDYPGAASFYDLATGTPAATLISPEPSDNDGFGYRVAASRRLAVVASGVPAAVRVYDGRRRLLGALDGCGWTAALAMRGRRIAALSECGIVVADWPRRRWTLDLPAGAGFGGALATDGDRVFVGAADRVVALDAVTGATLWTATAPEGSADDGFGTSLALVGGLLLVGAPRDDGDGADTGAVYLLDAATGAPRRACPADLSDLDSQRRSATSASVAEMRARSGNESCLPGRSADRRS